jgi:uncharacterized cupredoxin-like copper-binding protein
MTFQRRVIGIGAAGLVLAGCGGGGGGATTAQTAAPPATTKPATTAAPGSTGAEVTIAESEFKLDPAKPKVKAGWVTFKAVNNGTVAHALEIEGKGVEVKTHNIEPGKSQTLHVKLDKPGTYEMYCPVDGHKGQGMEGEITVQ